MRFRKSTHSVYNTQYHIVWTPRYRRKILVKGIGEYLQQMLLHLQGLEEDIEVKKVKVKKDHVHVVIPPRVSVAKVVKYMKSKTGKELKERFEFMEKIVYGSGGVWSRGYCVSTVGLNENKIMAYVEHQEKEDKGQLGLELGE